MEIDEYKVHQVPARDAPTVYKPPKTARYYPIKSGPVDVSIVPLRNILLDNDLIRIRLYQLRKAFNNDKYDQKNDLQGLKSLSNQFRNFYQDFKSKKKMNPVIVREAYIINNPSPSTPTQANILGLGAPLINKFPIETDYLYKVVDGNDLVALSVYFDYDHIPIITRF